MMGYIFIYFSSLIRSYIIIYYLRRRYLYHKNIDHKRSWAVTNLVAKVDRSQVHRDLHLGDRKRQ